MKSTERAVRGQFPGEWVLENWRLRAFPPVELPRLWWWRAGRIVVRRFVAAVAAWRERVRQRGDLRDLDLHLLRDIGVTSQQARHEWEKPYWYE